MNPPKNTRFFAWFDGVTAEADKTPAGQFMAGHGYTITHTGGGCLAWEKRLPGTDFAIWICDGDAGLGIEEHGDKFQVATDFGCMLTHHESGDYANGLGSVTVAECIAWGEAATANPDQLVAQEQCSKHRDNGRGICCDCGKVL